MVSQRKEPLVSIITPCYQGERYVHRFLDSVLNQTYNNIELIFINDGSTDATEKIVFSYVDKFKKRNIHFEYIFQENKGQAAALNRGLKIFKGEYLTWPDSDDILYRNNIKKRVDFLEQNPSYGIVICKGRMVEEKTFKPIRILERKIPKKKDNLFYDLLMGKNVSFGLSGQMVRGSAFLDVNPKREIFENRAGQNYQMLLPITYKYKCGYINEILWDYLVRRDSHSRSAKTKEDLLVRLKNIEIILENTIKSMHIPDEADCLEIIRKRYIRERLYVALKFKDKSLLNEQYKLLKKDNDNNFFDFIIYLRGLNPFFDYMYKVAIYPLRILRKLSS